MRLQTFFLGSIKQWLSFFFFTGLSEVMSGPNRADPLLKFVTHGTVTRIGST